MIRIGTSGYDYIDWKEVFYPADLKREQFLEYYSSIFSTVELNFSYYRMPSKEQLKSIIERSGKKIDFSIKAHSSLTHRIVESAWKDSAKEYIDAIYPLMDEGVLAAVLLQFPYSFHYTPDNRRYLNNLIEQMKAAPLVVEFRNSEWLNKRVFDALREREVAFCSVDAPRLKNLPLPVDITTSSMAYVRFHGRNEKTWWGSDAAARFDYKYSEEELKPWIDRIITMLRGIEKIRIYFNNHRRGQAVEDAIALKHLLEKEGLTEE